jgi:hypothetical protein
MNARLLVVAGLALVSIGGCASRAPVQKERSILEVIDQAQNVAPTQGLSCRGGAVTYCENDLGVKRCTCRDPEEVRAWLRRSFGGGT